MYLAIKKYFKLIVALIILAIIFPAIYIVGNPLMRGIIVDQDVMTREIRSNRHTQPEPMIYVENRLTTDGFRKVMENDNFEFWLREEVGSARVVDKRSGYVWGSLPADRPEVEPGGQGGLNATWAGIANSLVSINTFNASSQEAMIGSGHETVHSNFSVNGNVLTVDVYFSTQSIGFTYTITLTETGITFELLDETIFETDTFLLGSVFFWPFLGSTIGDEIPGYMFVPDGPGALIRFRTPINFISVYDRRVFGADLGIDNILTVSDLQSFRPNDFMAPEQDIHFPVFGMVHGSYQHGFFSILENGAEHAFVRAAPAGDRTDYNWIKGNFIYRQIFSQPINRAGVGVRTMQLESNVVNPRQSFHFFTGDDASYVGFARFYREYLGLEDRTPQMYDIPLMLDFIMNDIQRGFFFSRERTVTHNDTIVNATELMLETTNNLHINLLGWQRRGLSGHRGFTAHTPRRAVRNLANDLTDMGASVTFYLDPVRFKEIQISSSRVGTNLSQSPTLVSRDNPTIWLGTDVFLRPFDVVDVLSRQYAALDGFNITLNDLPHQLHSERLRARSYSRIEVMEMYLNQVRQMDRMPMYRPNVYMLPYASAVLSTPVVSSQMLFQTDTVPFKQIVLSGTMPMFAPYANVGFSNPIDILKHIDFNLYPTFILTGYENHYLMQTTLVDFNSTSFYNWKESIELIYTEINSVLRNVIGQQILNRSVLEAGIVRNEYETGIILVNYTADEFEYNGRIIPALTASFIPN